MSKNSDAPVNLYVKAGIDGFRNGGCPTCQHWFLVLINKEQGNLALKVESMNPHKMNPDVKAKGARHLPVVFCNDEVYPTVDEFIEFVDTAFPDVQLQYSNVDAENACENVFAKFCWYLKEVNKDPRLLIGELEKLDGYLQEVLKRQKFICRDEMCHLDCHMLPKLHHIRVAGGHLKQFEIPSEFTGIWQYLKNGYDCDLFRKSCPCDQDIIIHWADRPDTPNLTRAQVADIASQPKKSSFTMPVDLVD